MNRKLVAISMFVLLVAAACSVATPGNTGVVTAVNGNTVTVAAANGQSATYTLTNSTSVYNASGVRTPKSFLMSGQRVMVWAKGDNAVRINVES